MANLIPPHAKKGVVSEYWIRVTSVWLIMLGIVALVVAVLNIPAYIMIQNQKLAYQDMFADANDKTDAFTAIEQEIIVANETVRLLSDINQDVALHTYVSLIDSLANGRVSIEHYDLIRSEGNLSTIKISGVADNREALVNLSDTIEADDYFISADIPLSNLAKDSDIPFSISVVLADQTET